MRKSVILGITICALAQAAPGQAAPIRECGRLHNTYNGYQEVFNVTSRNVPCQKARNTANGLTWTMIGKGFDNWPRSPTYFTFRWTGWTARGHWYVHVYSELDLRATRPGGQVVHFQLAGE